jgi:hypothetical protein
MAGVSLLWPGVLHAEQVAVRHTEGLVHGFLILRSTAGVALAEGELLQSASGDRVTSRLVFRFKDGSLLDETTVFSQRGHFQLISDRLVQKGPTFAEPLEMSIDCGTGLVAVRYREKDGEQKVVNERMELPPDLANGMILTLLKNVGNAPPESLSMIAATPKPRLVKLGISIAGEDRFTTAAATRKAVHYVLKVDIGGVAGLVAPLVGKQPPDSHVWVLDGEAPAFVKSEGPMFADGPIWRIELVAPVWPRTGATPRKKK